MNLPKNIFYNKRDHSLRVIVKRDRQTYEQEFSLRKHSNALDLALQKRNDFIRIGGRGDRSRPLVSRHCRSNTGYVGISIIIDKKRGLYAARARWVNEDGKRKEALYGFGRIRSKEEAIKLAYNHRLIALQRRFKKAGVDVEGVFSE